MARQVKYLPKLLKSLGMLDKQTVEIAFHDDMLVERDGVMEVYKVLDEFTEGKKLKKLLIIGKNTEITKDARLLIVEKNDFRKNKIIAEAIVVNSFAQKLSANFYMMFLRNIYPIQFFTDRVKAEQWLKER